MVGKQFLQMGYASCQVLFTYRHNHNLGISPGLTKLVSPEMLGGSQYQDALEEYMKRTLYQEYAEAAKQYEVPAPQPPKVAVVEVLPTSKPKVTKPPTKTNLMRGRPTRKHMQMGVSGTSSAPKKPRLSVPVQERKALGMAPPKVPKAGSYKVPELPCLKHWTKCAYWEEGKVKPTAADFTKARQECEARLASQEAACAETASERASRLMLEQVQAELAQATSEFKMQAKAQAEELKAKDAELAQALAELAAAKAAKRT
jgi:hypothetical protein